MMKTRGSASCLGNALPLEVFMVHRNAPLSETGRLRLARCVVDDGWSLRRAAERFQVSVTTAARWAARYRALGDAGMADRSSRPHCSPGQTPTRTERRIIKAVSCAVGGQRESATCWDCTPPRCIGCWPDTEWPSCAGWTAPPDGLSVAWSPLSAGTWSMSMSKSSARSQPAGVGACWAARRATITRAPTKAAGSKVSVITRCTATTSCTPPLMDTPDWPTANCSPTNAKTPRVPVTC